jgi:hypothetical protein
MCPIAWETPLFVCNEIVIGPYEDRAGIKGNGVHGAECHVVVALSFEVAKFTVGPIVMMPVIVDINIAAYCGYVTPPTGPNAAINK